MRTWTERAAAFTLVELLVVIAVILILASLTMPTMDRALREARAVNCVSNLRQLNAAFVAYAGNHRGTLPNMFHTLSVSRPTWLQDAAGVMAGTPKKGQLWTYYRDERLVLCPVDAKGNGVFSYSSPVMLGNRLLQQVLKPSASILILDEHEAYHIGWYSVEGGFGSIDRPALRHGRATPVGYCDGAARRHEFPEGFEAYDVEIPPWGFNDHYPP